MQSSKRIAGFACRAILFQHLQHRSSCRAASATLSPNPEPERENAETPSSPPSAATTRSHIEPDPTIRHDAASSLYLPPTEVAVFPYAPASMATRRPIMRGPGFFAPATSLSRYRRLSDAPIVRSKEELLSFVGQYDDESADEHFEYLRDVYRRGYPAAPGPNVTVSDNRRDAQYPSHDSLDDEGPVAAAVEELRACLYLSRSKPEIFDVQEAYDIYRTLPEPRMLHLPGSLRHLLMSAMSGKPRSKDYNGMLRYFALVADVKDSGLTLTTSEWNTALSFASRYVGQVTEVETQAALRLWKEMEHDANIKGSEVTFNILFDVASKGGNFVLAEMVYEEMLKRGFTFNRYHQVSLIHYFGLKLDSGGIRAAYREMVESGEMIDSTVFNCVISGLLRCGEETDAEYVYTKMRDTHPRNPSLPPRDYFTHRVVTKVLVMFARVGRRNPEMQPLLQGQASITPDLQTYRILINHYSTKIGDLARVTRYLDEMQHFGVPIHGAIFLALFKGFSSFGGYVGSEWSPQRLEGVYNAFLRHCDNKSQGLYVGTWMAMWILRAQRKCGAGQHKLARVHAELSQRWELDDAEEAMMSDFLFDQMDRSR